MSDGSLPEGWQWVKLGETCKVDRIAVNPNSEYANQLPYLSLEHIESGSGQILTNNSDDYSDEVRSLTYAFDTRHVLYGKLRPYLNKVAIPSFAGRCTTELIPLLPIETDRFYLAWILRRPESVDAAMRSNTGSRMPRTNMKDFLELLIPLPPLEEQRRIVAIIAEQMADVEEMRQAALDELAAAEALSASYLREVFESEEAQGWEWVTIKDVTTKVDYGYTASADFSIDDPKFLRITDIQNGQVVWGGVPGCKISTKDEGKKALQDGDIVIARTGGTVGKSFLITDPPRAVFASYLIRLQPSSNIIPELLYAFFQSDSYWSQIYSVVRGGAQPNVNATMLKSLIFPLPPLEEQRRIMDILSSKIKMSQKIETAANGQLADIEATPTSILRRAFNGEY